MEDLVIEDGDGLKELHDWLFGRVADDNDIVVDKVRMRGTSSQPGWLMQELSLKQLG